jgi:endonuclease YncB( thermonuclease family)
MAKLLVLAAIALIALYVMGSSPVELLLRTVADVASLRFRLLHGTRIAIVDGDTIRFRRRILFGILGHDVVRGRLRGIDAPESDQPQGPASTHALRSMLLDGGWHLAISCRHDVYERELMWLVGLRGPVGLRMLWRGQAFSTTLAGAPVALVARLLRRGMWGKGRVTDPRAWRMRNDHGVIR